MLSLQQLTTLLCQDLLANPGDTDLAHITLNVPPHTVSALFRVAYDGSYFMTSWVATQTHCMGAIVMEPEGQYWQEPEMSSWADLQQYQEIFSVPPDPSITTFRSLDEHKQQFPDKALPEALPWGVVLRCFPSVEVVWQHPEKDVLEVLAGSGEDLCPLHDMEMLLLDLE